MYCTLPKYIMLGESKQMSLNTFIRVAPPFGTWIDSDSLGKFAKQNQYNGSCHRTVFNFYEMSGLMTPIIDKIFFDFDDYTPVKIIPELNEIFNEYLRVFILSGRGTHMIMKTNNIDEFSYKKHHLFLNEEYKLEQHDCIIGNTWQHRRVVGTANGKRGKMCQYVNPETFETSNKPTILKGSLLKIPKYEPSIEEKKRIKKFSNRKFREMTMSDFRYLKCKCGNLLNMLDETIHKIEPSHWERVMVIKELRYGARLPKEVTLKILENWLTSEKYHHVVYEEKMVDRLYGDRRK